MQSDENRAKVLRGIRAGLRADLVLVDGDASVNIGDTLSIRAVWCQGTRLAVEPVDARV